MYLEPWMLVILVLTYGTCAVWNRRKGYMVGVMSTLTNLEEDKFIRVLDDGTILPGIKGR
jgi:hypothetical protein